MIEYKVNENTKIKFVKYINRNLIKVILGGI